MGHLAKEAIFYFTRQGATEQVGNDMWQMPHVGSIWIHHSVHLQLSHHDMPGYQYELY